MIEEIRKLKELIPRLEYHFENYKEYKHQAKYASRKIDRDRSHKSMISSAGYIENLLLEWPCYGIIKNGNQFQFEDFWKYVESDMPDYLSALKTHLETNEVNDKEK